MWRWCVQSWRPWAWRTTTPRWRPCSPSTCAVSPRACDVCHLRRSRASGREAYHLTRTDSPCHSCRQRGRGADGVPRLRQVCGSEGKTTGCRSRARSIDSIRFDLTPPATRTHTHAHSKSTWRTRASRRRPGTPRTATTATRPSPRAT